MFLTFSYSVMNTKLFGSRCCISADKSEIGGFLNLKINLSYSNFWSQIWSLSASSLVHLNFLRQIFAVTLAIFNVFVNSFDLNYGAKFCFWNRYTIIKESKVSMCSRLKKKWSFLYRIICLSLNHVTFHVCSRFVFLKSVDQRGY